MAYRFAGADPNWRASIGAFNGYSLRGDSNDPVPLSGAILLKRNAVSAWHGLITCDDGSTGVYTDQLEFDATNHLAEWVVDDPGGSSAATFNDTTNWMIVGFCWDGKSAATWQWRWRIGAGAWSSEARTISGIQASPVVAGSGYRHLIGNEPGLGDDASMDVVCWGLIKANLSQASFESLTLTDIASWDSVFTGAGAILHGFDAIGSRVDRTGNGGNEVTRNGVTLVADPAGWQWSAGGAYVPRPLVMRLGRGLGVKVPILTRTAPAPPAAVTTAVSNAVVLPVEALGAAAQTASAPAETAAAITTSSSLPSETTQGIAQTAAAAAESSQGVAAATSAPAEAAGAIAASASAPAETVGAVAPATRVLPAEATGGIAGSSSAPAEAAQGLSTGPSLPAEALAGVAAASQLPAEAQGLTAVSQSVSIPAESLAGVASTAVAPVELLAAVLAAAVLPAESEQRVVAAAALPGEAASGVAKASAALPSESLQAVVAQLLLPAEASGSGAIELVGAVAI